MFSGRLAPEPIVASTRSSVHHINLKCRLYNDTRRPLRLDKDLLCVTGPDRQR